VPQGQKGLGAGKAGHGARERAALHFLNGLKKWIFLLKIQSPFSIFLK
jgi:hypothetical protein